MYSSRISLSILSINSYFNVGALVSPKGITKYSKSLYLMRKTVFYSSPSLCVREIPVKCRIRQNAEFPTLTAIHKNFHYIITILIYIIKVKLVINRRYTKRYLKYIYYIVKYWGRWICQPWNIIIRTTSTPCIIITIIGLITYFL